MVPSRPIGWPPRSTPAVRMDLLEALSDAAAEITSGLDGTVVEVRLKGRQPQFVVTGDRRLAPPPHRPDDGRRPTTTARTTARITLRLPDGLKVARRGGRRPAPASR